ncbi:MAG: hypothetical protein V1822_00965 [Candidatus Micrarchaeota archaeon]
MRFSLFALMAALAGLALLLGCTQQEAPAPQFPAQPDMQPSANDTAAMPGQMPAINGSSGPQIGENSDENATPPPPSGQINGSGQNGTQEPPQTASGQNNGPPAQPSSNSLQPQQNQTRIAQALAACQNLAQVQVASCAAQSAIENDDVSVCTRLSLSDDVFSCIAQWCLSAQRDFTQCEKLSDIDLRLGCLSKCNPNPNS